jgi:hypothetical protein
LASSRRSRSPHPRFFSPSRPSSRQIIADSTSSRAVTGPLEKRFRAPKVRHFEVGLTARLFSGLSFSPRVHFWATIAFVRSRAHPRLIRLPIPAATIVLIAPTSVLPIRPPMIVLPSCDDSSPRTNDRSPVPVWHRASPEDSSPEPPLPFPLPSRLLLLAAPQPFQPAHYSSPAPSSARLAYRGCLLHIEPMTVLPSSPFTRRFLLPCFASPHLIILATPDHLPPTFPCTIPPPSPCPSQEIRRPFVPPWYRSWHSVISRWQWIILQNSNHFRKHISNVWPCIDRHIIAPTRPIRTTVWPFAPGRIRHAVNPHQWTAPVPGHSAWSVPNILSAFGVAR